jgi:hypothetical protein
MASVEVQWRLECEEIKRDHVGRTRSDDKSQITAEEESTSEHKATDFEGAPRHSCSKTATCCNGMSETVRIRRSQAQSIERRRTMRMLLKRVQSHFTCGSAKKATVQTGNQSSKEI